MLLQTPDVRDHIGNRGWSRTSALTAEDAAGADADAGEAERGRIARLLKIHVGIKPPLTVISALPVIPSGCRAALHQRPRHGRRRCPQRRAEFKAGRGSPIHPRSRALFGGHPEHQVSSVRARTVVRKSNREKYVVCTAPPAARSTRRRPDTPQHQNSGYAKSSVTIEFANARPRPRRPPPHRLRHEHLEHRLHRPALRLRRCDYSYLARLDEAQVDAAIELTLTTCRHHEIDPSFYYPSMAFEFPRCFQVATIVCHSNCRRYDGSGAAELGVRAGRGGGDSVCFARIR
jgi:hypothetical protein